MPAQPYRQVVRSLKAMMGIDRSEREPYLRAAAEAIVTLRQQYKLADGLPDWSGSDPAYKAEIQRAYREAGVPPDSADTVQAALRYHVGNRVRELASPAQLDALSLDRKGPNQRQREAPKRPAKAVNGSALPPIPPVLAQAIQDPVGLVTHAIRTIEAARELKPAGAEADTVRILLRPLWEAVADLAAVVDRDGVEADLRGFE